MSCLSPHFLGHGGGGMSVGVVRSDSRSPGAASRRNDSGKPARSPLSRFVSSGIKYTESFAPFAAGILLFGNGVSATAAGLGYPLPAGALAGASLPAALLLSGAGAGLMIAAYERWHLQRVLHRTRHDLNRAHAQRDMALTQARKMRTQAEGLALMREIHRSTSIPVRHERLRRILTLLADLFEAREVSLFALGASGLNAVSLSGRPQGKAVVIPAACLRISKKEEVFIAFESEELAAQFATESPAQIAVAKKGATIEREGCQLFVDGILECGNVPVAKAQWRRGVNSDHDALTTQDSVQVLEEAVSKVDYGTAARAMAAQALEHCRTVRDGLVLCVPLLADQRPIGVLRIRRSVDAFDGQEAEALEELLLESAKHIALALKKDEDDRAAITDALTSLFIKKHFLSVLEQLRAEAASSNVPFCLILCDIDHFKKVNDTHGHLSGDMILRGVAGVLRKGLRTGDIAFRYGGEEMAVLLPNSSVEAAEQTAGRLRAAVEGSTFLGEKGQVVAVTISLGLTQYQTGLNSEAMISQADRALYASKEGGRNRSTRWTAELED